EDYHVGEIPESRVDELNAAYRMGLEHDFLIIPSTGLLMEPLIGRIGIDAIGRHAISNPKHLDKVCETIMKVPYKKMELMCKTDIPVIIIPDDCAYKGRPILSPKMYKRFIIPHFSKMIDMAHEKGKLVIFHSDGLVEPYYDMLIDAGLDAHQSLEPVAGNDLKEIKEKYAGRLSFIGNIDSSRLLPFGTRQDVIDAVKYCLRYGAPGGGYMFSPCTDLTDSCRLDNTEIMMATYKKYRKYPITIP
ncbi:MAG: uroporphyrinogen decarboxylase family protein, partial [Promethearchaeota archaeon]